MYRKGQAKKIDVIERVYGAARARVAREVMWRQSSMTLNDSNEWVDVEADEVTVRRIVTGSGEAMWVSYLGLVRRGAPQSLILLRLENRVTKKRSPGPGPLRSTDWIKVAKHFVDNERIILHIDGAKAYMADFEQFRHTKVTHKVKKGADGNWIKPRYVEPVEVSTPNGTLSLLAGTEVIDGLWKHIPTVGRPR
eukprot:3335584-Amphidinium_carterae.1